MKDSNVSSETTYANGREHCCTSCTHNKPTQANARICRLTKHVRRFGKPYVETNEVHDCYNEGHGIREILLKSRRNVIVQEA